MSPCEDGSGKPATGMKLTPRWPHTAFSCTTEGWAWARTRGGSVSYMCRVPAAGEQSGVATISCETYGRTTCTPLVCIHTVTEYRTGWLGMRECHPTARRITTISDGGARRGHDPRDRRSGSGRARPDAAWDAGAGWRVSGVDRTVASGSVAVARASRFTTPTSAHVKKTSFESVSA